MSHAEDLTFGDHLALLWRRRWIVLGIWALVVLAGAAYWWLAPRQYTATTVLLPPKESGGSTIASLAAASAMAGALPGITIPSGTQNRDALIAILKSRSIARAAVEKFDLKTRYRVRFVDDAIKEFLEKRSSVDLTAEGSIVVSVEDRDPKIAAEVVNFVTGLADRYVVDFGMLDAGRQHGFLTSQLTRARADLAAAAEALRRFQERNKAIVLQDQTRVAIEAAARLKAEIVAAEVQLQVLRGFATDANPEVIALRQRIDETNRHLAKIQYGLDTGAGRVVGANGADFLVPFNKVPEIGLELARLTQEVRIQEAVVTVLTQQTEQARIGQANDVPTVKVLDRAVPPERPSWPKLLLILALAGGLGLFGSIFVVFTVEYFRGTAARQPRTA